MTPAVIAYGGGVQSTALLVLTTGMFPDRFGGGLPVRAALFSNVGDDSEDPLTLQYVREVARPWAAARGVEVIELRRQRRDGREETLWGRLMREGSRSLPIPVRMSHNGAPGTRSCTADFKLRVIAKWLKTNGASKVQPWTVNLGISWDEIQRIRNRVEAPYERIAYPLIDRRLTREDCKRIIERAGLPVPPKSSCFFCPYHRPAVWAAMRRDRPDLFRKAVLLEDVLNDRRDRLGKHRVWLTRFGRPLNDAITEAQPTLADVAGDESCDEGVCWT